MSFNINKEEFLKDNAGLIKSIAGNYYFETPKFSFEDLVAVGNHGALLALNKFDSSKQKSKVSTYVYKAASRKIRDFVRKNKHDLAYTAYAQQKHYKSVQNGETNTEYSGPNSPKAMRLNYDIDFGEGKSLSIINVVPSGEPPPEQKMMIEEQKEILLNEINALKPRQRDVIVQRHFDGATLREVGTNLGVSKQAVQQIECKAMKILKNRLEKRLGGFIARSDGLAARSK